MGGKAQFVQFYNRAPSRDKNPTDAPSRRPDYAQGIQEHSILPYMANCVWVYSVLGSKTRESAPKSTARNTRARRMAKSLKIKDKNTVDTLNPMS